MILAYNFSGRDLALTGFLAAEGGAAAGAFSENGPNLEASPLARALTLFLPLTPGSRLARLPGSAFFPSWLMRASSSSSFLYFISWTPSCCNRGIKGNDKESTLLPINLYMKITSENHYYKVT